MTLLDMFCGAGGAAMGYARAGFNVVGVDITPQPHYPFTFVLGDALEYVAAHGQDFDAIHASPPCQRYSELTPRKYRKNTPDFIPTTRSLLKRTGKPWVIENVQNARGVMRLSVMLCGTMFGRRLWRHRYFENEFGLAIGPNSCNHSIKPVIVHPNGHSRRDSVRICRQIMDIPWMTGTELLQAVPPFYTEWLGRQLLAAALPAATGP